MADAPPTRAVIYEIVRSGAYAKAIAVDVESGIEAAIVGPASAHDRDLRRLAAAKLAHLLSARDEDAGDPPRGGPGIVV
jgi:D-arabinose 5-phosphate isomerase GutQ